MGSKSTFSYENSWSLNNLHNHDKLVQNGYDCVHWFSTGLQSSVFLKEWRKRNYIKKKKKKKVGQKCPKSDRKQPRSFYINNISFQCLQEQNMKKWKNVSSLCWESSSLGVFCCFNKVQEDLLAQRSNMICH